MNRIKKLSNEQRFYPASPDTMKKSRKLFRKIIADVQTESIEGFELDGKRKSSPPFDTSSSPGSPKNVLGLGSPSFFYDKLSAGIQMKFDFQEYMIIRSFTFSLVLVILIVILVYFSYQLVGDYLTLIFFSLLTSVALRPLKRELKLRLRSTLGLGTYRKHKSPFFTRSFIYKGISALIQFFKRHFIARSKQSLNPFEKFTNVNFLNIVSDVYGLGYLTLAYFLHSRLGLDACLILCVGILIGDFVVRILLDIFKEVFRRLSFCRRLGVRLQKHAKVHEMINSGVTTLLIITFALGLLGFFTIGVTLLVVDLQEILSNAQSFIQTIVNYVNPYLGDSSPFDEESIISFMKKYHDSIGSFLNNTELNGTYTAFSCNNALTR